MTWRKRGSKGMQGRKDGWTLKNNVNCERRKSLDVQLQCPYGVWVLISGFGGLEIQETCTGHSETSKQWMISKRDKQMHGTFLSRWRPGQRETLGVPSNGMRAERFQQHHLWQGRMARSLRYYIEYANLSWSCKRNVYIQTYGDRDRWQGWVTCGRAAQHCEEPLSVVLSRIKAVMDTLPGPQLCRLWKGQTLSSHQAALRVTQCPQKHPGSCYSLARPKYLS